VRTTIELKPEHRARLADLAARKGTKGFSSIIAEAVPITALDIFNDLDSEPPDRLGPGPKMQLQVLRSFIVPVRA
jgi:hypothetical protein